jgi:hypothetical protein
MSWLQPSFGYLVNLTAALRKNLLIPSGFFSPNDNTSFIWSPSTVSANPVALNGTIDGTNAIFTTANAIVNGIAVFKNGLLQEPGVMYNVSGSNTITFVSGYIPEPGDYLQAVLGTLAGGPLPANATSAISVGSSPFVYTAGQTQEVIYISGGVVTNLTKNGIQIISALPCTVVLQPTESITVTYTSAPLMVKST